LREAGVENGGFKGIFDVIVADGHVIQRLYFISLACWGLF